MSDFIVGTMQAGSNSSILKFDAAGKKLARKKRKAKQQQRATLTRESLKGRKTAVAKRLQSTKNKAFLQNKQKRREKQVA